jgi:hypothetical protein
VVVGGAGAQLEVAQVQETSSVATVISGSAQVGQLVRFRPSRPKDVAVKASPKRGALVTWRGSSEPEVTHYFVYRSESPNGPWGRPIKKVRKPEREHNDRSARAGVTYHYRVKAVGKNGTESLPSAVVTYTAR